MADKARSQPRNLPKKNERCRKRLSYVNSFLCPVAGLYLSVRLTTDIKQT